MHRNLRVSFMLAVLVSSSLVFSQPNRIKYNNQQLFFNGANLAWVSFASDIGSQTPTDTATFGNIMLQIHNSGGNVMRWWLHVNGSVTPVFDTSNYVTGPGAHTIADMRKVLDMAWQREVGLDLCLWSFDMLRATNDSLVLAQNLKLLTDTNYTRAYINNCLIPMVDSLKGHPAIAAWEIFNEPEGMSNPFHYGGINTVSMAVIQRFVNLCAGAIHRADPNALVTNGCWSFQALTDEPAPLADITAARLQNLSAAEKETRTRLFNRQHRLSATTDEVMNYLIRLSTIPNQNYYSDNALITAGGDPNGTLDFYSVHYYSGDGVPNSPFDHPANAWGLDKPILVGEFAMESGQGNPDVPTPSLFDTLYAQGYAGGMPWSWTNQAFSSAADMMAGMKSIYTNHKSDVAVNGITVDWPTITITSPLNNSAFPDSTQMTFRVMVLDTLPVNSINFFVADTQSIGSVNTPDSVRTDTLYYSFVWKNIPAGQYVVKAVAANNVGHQGVSNLVQLSFGKPPMTRLEAESASWNHLKSGVSVAKDASASGGAYLKIATSDTTIKITWTFKNLGAAGNYLITFGYRLEYESPKTQFINVNGVRVDALVFSGASTTTWYETGINVNLVQDTNTIQVQLSWGYMDLDYLAVPTILVTSVAKNPETPISYSLSQNYPNPFNPTTNINFALQKSSMVKLTIYNILGQKISTLVYGQKAAGYYSVPFDGSHLASGVYFYRLETSEFTAQKKMLLLK